MFSRRKLKELMSKAHPKGQPDCPIVKVEEKIEVKLMPKYLENLEIGVCKYLNRKLLRWHKDLQGVLLAYGSLGFSPPTDDPCSDENYFSLDVDGFFWVFRPEVGCELKGVVTMCCSTHISCLVLGLFKVTCFKPDHLDEESNWFGDALPLGKTVRLTVLKIEVSQMILSFVGRLKNEEPTHEKPIVKIEVAKPLLDRVKQQNVISKADFQEEFLQIIKKELVDENIERLQDLPEEQNVITNNEQILKEEESEDIVDENFERLLDWAKEQNVITNNEQIEKGEEPEDTLNQNFDFERLLDWAKEQNAITNNGFQEDVSFSSSSFGLSRRSSTTKTVREMAASGTVVTLDSNLNEVTPNVARTPQDLMKPECKKSMKTRRIIRNMSLVCGHEKGHNPEKKRVWMSQRVNKEFKTHSRKPAKKFRLYNEKRFKKRKEKIIKDARRRFKLRKEFHNSRIMN